MNIRYFIVMSIVLSVAPCLGDTIYLKDGDVEKSDKVWEKDGYIHFILNGTKRVEIRYAKEIVDRVEGASFTRKKSVGAPVVAKENQYPRGRNRLMAATSDPKLSHEILTQYEDQLNQLSGIGFYDPRRRAKYWTSITLHYDSLKEAIAALAKQYNQAPAWIIANMGKTNDLGVIHKNLIESIRKGKEFLSIKTVSVVSDQNKTAAATAPSPTSVSTRKSQPPQNPDRQATEKSDSLKNIPFYNPRRALKYWSDEHTGHHTIAEAINAIAQKYHRRPDWVEENMGRVNDLGKIHQNLMRKLEK